jgi:malic enzyme
VQPTVDVTGRYGLAMAYTPRVARVCTAIAEEPGLAAEYTWVSNTVAVISDGTAPAIASMAGGAIVFALSNPDPEVHPDVAGRHALVVATGRSNFPNQINNSLAFPGVFRGALDTRASDITDGMKLAAAEPSPPWSATTPPPPPSSPPSSTPESPPPSPLP